MWPLHARESIMIPMTWRTWRRVPDKSICKRNCILTIFILQKDILSFPAVTYAKLAALKGYDLAIEHDLVPKDLIKVNPNPVYTDPYHFLKENG